MWVRLKTIVKVANGIQRTNLTISGDTSFLRIKFLCYMVVLVEYYNQHKKIHSATTHFCEISQSENMVVDKITENAKKKKKSQCNLKFIVRSL